jgi:hypothetical protein
MEAEVKSLADGLSLWAAHITSTGISQTTNPLSLLFALAYESKVLDLAKFETRLLAIKDTLTKQKDKRDDEQLSKNKARLKTLVAIKDTIDNHLHKSEALRSIAEFQRPFDSPGSDDTLKEAATLVTQKRWISGEDPINWLFLIGTSLIGILCVFLKPTTEVLKPTVDTWGKWLDGRINRKGKEQATDKKQSPETPKVEENGKSVTVASPPV